MEDLIKKCKELRQIDYKGFLIVQVEYPILMEEIGKLRVDVWKEIDGINPDLVAKNSWIDKTDSDAMHWVIIKDNKLVGSARMTNHEEIEDLPYSDMIQKHLLKKTCFPVSSLNRLVIHPDYQNMGLGRKIDEIRLDTAKKMGIKCIVAEPVSWRINSLKKSGFVYIGPINYPYEAPGIMLHLMTRKLEK
ncbi:MAG: GNAT family N-acetyltransferase [Bacteroidetes bacterium]|nr:GNAT family N-acetyltransferase [Bacteroidota bacterium]